MQVLLQLAELGSVQRTADSIGMTQSSVTQTLAYLEKLLDLSLFERHARGVRPTPACKDLLPVARQLMQGIAEGVDVVVARQRQGDGVVRMIGSAAAINGLLVNTLAEFSDRFPAIQIQLREAEGEDQLLAITRGEVDLIACRRPAVIPEGWQFQSLREDRLAILCRAGHPLARARTLGWNDLASQTWLQVPVGLAARASFDELSKSFPRPPVTYPVVTRSMAMVWWLMRNRDLLALLSKNLAQPLLDAGRLVELPIGEPAALEPLGLLQPDRGLEGAAMRLSEFFQAATSIAAPVRAPRRKPQR